MAHDREIAGIRCTQILDGLSDYLSGELSPDVRGQIENHLAGCSWCEQFGGEFSTVVHLLRAQRTQPPSDAETGKLLDLLNLEAS